MVISILPSIVKVCYFILYIIFSILKLKLTPRN